ncbi:hypothetical protein HHUSO_G31848, partial [Huso huso]
QVNECGSVVAVISALGELKYCVGRLEHGSVMLALTGRMQRLSVGGCSVEILKRCWELLVSVRGRVRSGQRRSSVVEMSLGSMAAPPHPGSNQAAHMQTMWALSVLVSTRRAIIDEQPVKNANSTTLTSMFLC